MSTIVHNDGSITTDGDLPFGLSAHNIEPDGLRTDANQAEVMGEFMNQRYSSREMAQIAADEAQADAREFYPNVVVEVVS